VYFNALTSLFHFPICVEMEMEWYEPIISLHAAVTTCNLCRCHSERLKPHMQDFEDAEGELSGAWTCRQRGVAQKKLMGAQWWQAAITRELQWHLVEDHGIILKDPGWTKQSGDNHDNEETLHDETGAVEVDAGMCIY